MQKFAEYTQRGNIYKISKVKNNVVWYLLDETNLYLEYILLNKRIGNWIKMRANWIFLYIIKWFWRGTRELYIFAVKTSDKPVVAISRCHDWKNDGFRNEKYSVAGFNNFSHNRILVVCPMVVSRIPSPVYCSLRMLFKAELRLPFAFTAWLTYSSQLVKCSVDDTINFKKL